jgi:hypothetical protein
VAREGATARDRGEHARSAGSGSAQAARADAPHTTPFQRLIREQARPQHAARELAVVAAQHEERGVDGGGPHQRAADGVDARRPCREPRRPRRRALRRAAPPRLLTADALQRVGRQHAQRDLGEAPAQRDRREAHRRAAAAAAARHHRKRAVLLAQRFARADQRRPVEQCRGDRSDLRRVARGAVAAQRALREIDQRALRRAQELRVLVRGEEQVRLRRRRERRVVPHRTETKIEPAIDVAGWTSAPWL